MRMFIVALLCALSYAQTVNGRLPRRELESGNGEFSGMFGGEIKTAQTDAAKSKDEPSVPKEEPSEVEEKRPDTAKATQQQAAEPKQEEKKVVEKVPLQETEEEKAEKKPTEDVKIKGRGSSKQEADAPKKEEAPKKQEADTKSSADVLKKEMDKTKELEKMPAADEPAKEGDKSAADKPAESKGEQPSLEELYKTHIDQAPAALERIRLAANKLDKLGKDAKGVEAATKEKVKEATESLEKAEEQRKDTESKLKQYETALQELHSKKDALNKQIEEMNKKIADEQAKVSEATDADRKAQAEADAAADAVAADKQKAADDQQKADLKTIEDANEKIKKLKDDNAALKQESEKRGEKLTKIGDIAKLTEIAKSINAENTVAKKKNFNFDSESSLADLPSFEEFQSADAPVADSVVANQGSNKWFYGLIVTNVISVGIACKFYFENAKMRSFHYDLLEEF